jgi:hypothetical protein
VIARTSRPSRKARSALAAAGVGAAGLVIAACGSTSPSGLASLPTLPAGLQATPSAAVGPTTGNLGDTLSMVDNGDDVAHVTLVKIFDPATGYDPNTTPPDGTRWVGFEGTIVIDGSRAGQDDTSVEVIGSDGQTYGANTAYSLSVFDGCVASDVSSIQPGQTQTFCSAVGLPPGVTVAKIGYSTQGVEGNAPAKLFWTVTSDQAPAATATPTADNSAPTDTSTPDDGAPTDTPTPDGGAPTDTPSPSPSPTPS